MSWLTMTMVFIRKCFDCSIFFQRRGSIELLLSGLCECKPPWTHIHVASIGKQMAIVWCQCTTHGESGSGRSSTTQPEWRSWMRFRCLQNSRETAELQLETGLWVSTPSLYTPTHPPPPPPLSTTTTMAPCIPHSIPPPELMSQPLIRACVPPLCVSARATQSVVPGIASGCWLG